MSACVLEYFMEPVIGASIGAGVFIIVALISFLRRSGRCGSRRRDLNGPKIIYTAPTVRPYPPTMVHGTVQYVSNPNFQPQPQVYMQPASNPVVGTHYAPESIPAPSAPVINHDNDPESGPITRR